MKSDDEIVAEIRSTEYEAVASEIRCLGLRSVRDQNRIHDRVCAELNLKPILVPGRKPLLDYLRNQIELPATAEQLFQEFGTILYPLEVEYLNEES